jgi:hypothetical protein
MSRYPTIAPPIAMKTKQTYCILLKLLGNLKIMPTRRQKITINFLKAINAANGIKVKQNEDKMLIVHMMNEYGSIKATFYFLNFPPPMVENTATLTNL